MSARPMDDSWTYNLKPPAGLEVAHPHTFDMQTDVCVNCGVRSEDIEDRRVSYECDAH